MPEAWELQDTRLISTDNNLSAVNAELVTVGAPGPAPGKLWSVIAYGYYPSVQENQVVGIVKYNSRTGHYYGLLNPVALTLNPTMATFIEQGMTYLLLPGEYIYAYRLGHTVGSAMQVFLQYIETDQPLYEYVEPQVRKSINRFLSTIRPRMGGGGGRPAAGIAPPVVPPGGGGGRER